MSARAREMASILLVPQQPDAGASSTDAEPITITFDASDAVAVGRYELGPRFQYVSRKQAVLRPAQGNLAGFTLEAAGANPTGHRRSGSEWEWIAKGSPLRVLNVGDQIALDAKLASGTNTKHCHPLVPRVHTQCAPQESNRLCAPALRFSNGCAIGCDECDGSTRGPIPSFECTDTKCTYTGKAIKFGPMAPICGPKAPAPRAPAPTTRLRENDRELMWKFRYQLTNEKKALTKLLKCVDWADQREVHAAYALLQLWVSVDVQDLLELHRLRQRTRWRTPFRWGSQETGVAQCVPWMNQGAKWCSSRMRRLRMRCVSQRGSVVCIRSLRPQRLWRGWPTQR